MASTNDEIKGELEALYPGYDVAVEGIGVDISPFRIYLRNKVDGHEHVFDTADTRGAVLGRIREEVMAEVVVDTVLEPDKYEGGAFPAAEPSVPNRDYAEDFSAVYIEDDDDDFGEDFRDAVDADDVDEDSEGKQLGFTFEFYGDGDDDSKGNDDDSGPDYVGTDAVYVKDADK